MPAPHTLSVVTTLCDRFAHFRIMLSVLEAANGEASMELVVVDYSSRDGDVKKALAGSRLVTNYIRLPRPFRRARGLNVGFKQAVGNSVLFTDVDIIHPRTIRRDVVEVTGKGAAFFPICRDLGPRVAFGNSLSAELRKPGALGKFRTSGFGLCAFPRAVFERLRWGEDFIRWGKEDNDLYARTRAAKVPTVRRKLPGLFHMWHPRKSYYLNKNYITPKKGPKK